MDFWSFSSNDEVNAVILSREFAIAMEEMFARILNNRPDSMGEWKRDLCPSRSESGFRICLLLVIDNPGTFPVANNWYGFQEHSRLTVPNGSKKP